MGDSSKPSDSPLATLGFLTVVENEQFGLVGGFLVLGASGRPLEFHCTAPVKPSRAQQILYGPTLTPYLYGEQIAQALINKAGVEPMIVWADQLPVLAVRDFVSLPVAALIPEGQQAPHQSQHFDAITSFAVGPYQVAVTTTHQADAEQIKTAMSAFPTFDLSEPFERVRGALEEAQRAASRQAA